MIAKMTSVFVVLAAVAVVALAVPFPESSPAESPLRTLNRENECEYYMHYLARAPAPDGTWRTGGVLLSMTFSRA